MVMDKDMEVINFFISIFTVYILKRHVFIKNFQGESDICGYVYVQGHLHGIDERRNQHGYG